MVARGSSHYYYVALFPNRRKDPGKVGSTPASLLRTNNCYAVAGSAGVQSGCSIEARDAFLVGGFATFRGGGCVCVCWLEFKIKIRISLFRKPFLSKKTEAGTTWGSRFFFSLVGSTVSTPSSPGICVESEDADPQAAVPSAQPRRQPCSRPRRESDVEVAG